MAFGWIKRAGVALVTVLGAAAIVAGLAGTASALPVPFTDTNAIGTLGFCDQSGHEVTSGKIGAGPFAWTAVSSVPAPTGYDAAHGRASLFVYQPIKDVDPGDWSGKQMTAASLYTNAAHPMAQATVLDPALVDFVSVFPPHWDGLVQFRMFFSAPLQPQHTETYPAAVVQVIGDSWTLVSGGHVDCHAGKGVSVETRNLPASVFQSAKPRATPGVNSPRAGSSAPSHGPAAASGALQTAGATPSNTVAAGLAAHSTKSAGSAPWWLVIVLVAAAAGGGFAWRLRRRLG